MLNKNNLGFCILISALAFYFLWKAPFHLSVVCSNVNEGYYFVYGLHFLDGYGYRFLGGPLFNLFYALVVKIFGFKTYSIIIVHFLHTLIVLLTGIILYKLIKQLYGGNLIGGFTVLFWVLLISFPIGGWGYGTMEGELESSFALEAEWFCVLFSLASIYLMLKNTQAMSLIAGLLAIVSFMFKPSGAVLGISIVCWLVYLSLFERSLFYKFKNNFLFIFLGIFLGLLLYFLYICFFLGSSPVLFLKKSFSVGSYTTQFFESPVSFWNMLWKFMTRYIPSLNNFFLFLFAFLCYVWVLLRNLFVKVNSDLLKLFLPLLSIWGLGSVCAVMAPGVYGSYYYVLIWPSIAIVLNIALKDILSFLSMRKLDFLKVVLVILVSIFFVYRFYAVLPNYKEYVKVMKSLSISSQKESFQDPVILSNQNSKRPEFLRIADLINSFLTSKNDTVYIFNLTKKHLTFTPFIYIYIKRASPTTVFSDILQNNEKVSKMFLRILKEDLIERSPKIILMPREFKIEDWQLAVLPDFLDWLHDFLKKNYYLKDSIDYKCSGYLCHAMKEIEKYDIFERKL